MPEENKASFSIDDVLAILNKNNAQVAEQNQINLIAAIQELRKPTPEEQAKLDKERAKTKERAYSAAQLAKAHHQALDNAAKGCPHGTRHKGTQVFTHQFRAQVMTPAGEKPYYIPRCTQCGSTWDRVYGLASPKIMAIPEQLQGGVNMCDWSMDEVLRMVEWAKRNPVSEREPQLV